MERVVIASTFDAECKLEVARTLGRRAVLTITMLLYDIHRPSGSFCLHLIGDQIQLVRTKRAGVLCSLFVRIEACALHLLHLHVVNFSFIKGAIVLCRSEN